MGRKSFNSKQNFLAATSLSPNAAKRGGSLADQLKETRLRSEQAKLALLEAELPDESETKFTRYVDMPPPTPEDEADFHKRFRAIMKEIKEARGKSGPDEGQTVQDWLIKMGASLPDLPEWKVPLYLEKFVQR